MNETKIKISANEINRYSYCPYQWYYKKVYGASKLQQMYKASPHATTTRTNNLVRGTKYHNRYYRHYQLMRGLKLFLLLALIGLLIGWGCSQWLIA